MAEDDWHETKIRVRYKDTDRMGVVYYGNYLTFFEVGRSEFMRDLGFPYSNLEAHGYHMVVTEAIAKYHSNVGYDAIVTVKTKVSDLAYVRMRFDYEVVDDGGILLVSGQTAHACLDSNLKPTKIPAELRTALKGKIKSGQ